MTTTVAILALHKVGAPSPGGWETWNYVSEDTLRGFLRVLGEEGWHIVDHESFVDGLRGERTLPERTAMVTFDDGYASMLHNAAPVLEEFDAPGVLFVPTDYVGHTNIFDQDNEPEERMCTWDELRELRDRGWSIQSHSKTHATFSSLTPDARRIELEEPKAQLEEELETRIDGFAFPYGDEGEDDAAIAETHAMLEAAGYRVAYRYKGGLAEPAKTPRFAMTRIPLGPDSDLRRWLRGD